MTRSGDDSTSAHREKHRLCAATRRGHEEFDAFLRFVPRWIVDVRCLAAVGIGTGAPGSRLAAVPVCLRWFEHGVRFRGEIPGLEFCVLRH